MVCPDCCWIQCPSIDFGSVYVALLGTRLCSIHGVSRLLLDTVLIYLFGCVSIALLDTRLCSIYYASGLLLDTLSISLFGSLMAS